MSTKSFGMALGAVLLSSACAHAPTAAQQQNQPQPVAQTETNPTPTVDDVVRQKELLISQSDGTQPGRISRFTGDTLTVDDPSAASSMTLGIDSSVPVFQGTQKIGTDMLAEGQDVRVFYKNQVGDAQPQAIAIELVDQGHPKADTNEGSTHQNDTNEGSTNQNDSNTLHDDSSTLHNDSKEGTRDSDQPTAPPPPPPADNAPSDGN